MERNSITPQGTRLLRLGGISLLWRPRSAGFAAILLGCGLVLAAILLGTGTIRLSLPQILAGLGGGGEDPVIARVIQRVRLPRLLTAAAVGAALGMAGAVFQSLSRNPLGSPDVIGFTTGAASGAIAAITMANAGPFPTAVAAVAAGLATALAVLALARRGESGGDGGYRLILIGIGAGAVLGGANTLMLAMGNLDLAMSAQIWLAGSLTARNWSHVATGAAGLALFAPVVLLNARRLAVMEMGEDMARQLGVPLRRSRALLVLAAVGLTSVATACTGPIAFVALAGPQLARALSRAPEPPLLSGALAGAVLLLAADLTSQSAPFGLAMPIGLTTAFLGGLYLLYVLTRGSAAGR